MRLASVALLIACGGGEPEFAEADFVLVGMWALEESVDTGTVETETTVAFADDATWELVDAGDRCDAGPFYAWYCDGPGTWSLAPEALLADEDATLTVTQRDDEAPEAFDAWFDETPDRFCWKEDLLGLSCLARQAAAAD